MSAAMGRPRLKDTPDGVRFRADRYMLMGRRSDGDVETIVKRDMFAGVHSACYKCPQARVDIEHRRMDDVILAHAHCAGQPSYHEVETVSVAAYGDPFERMMARPRVVHKCPDEAPGYTGKRMDWMVIDEVSEFAVPKRPEPAPAPEPAKYESFGDW